jgi:hypothetical protein
MPYALQSRIWNNRYHDLRSVVLSQSAVRISGPQGIFQAVQSIKSDDEVPEEVETDESMVALKEDTTEKDMHYVLSYRPCDSFWGLGIENERYLEMSRPQKVSKEFLLNRHKRERYSVDYYDNYKPTVFSQYIRTFVEQLQEEELEIPVLLNSHSLARTDRRSEHRTLYTKDAPANPTFEGKTVMELLQATDPYFTEEYGRSFIFDGDTIEFVTTGFYKATIDSAMDELHETQTTFIRKLRALFDRHDILKPWGAVDLCRNNHGFAMFLTNPENLAIFNNMTLNINITLPSHLNECGRIADPISFVSQHQNAIRAVQWMEPLWVALYGAPDILSSIQDPTLPVLTKASQRCAISRYIGIGTYDTDTMPTGKILTLSYKDHPYSTLPFWWYHAYVDESGYSRMPTIGLDINFNKHVNHGMEIRFWDHVNERDLRHILHVLSWLMDHALVKKKINNPVRTMQWNEIMGAIIREGRNACVSRDVWSFFLQELGVSIDVPENSSVEGMYSAVSEWLSDTYGNGPLTMRLKGIRKK